MNIKIYLSTIIFLAIITTSCNNDKIPLDFDYGKVEKGKYVNSYFDFEITLPTDWVVSTKEEMKKINEVGQALAAGDDEKFKTQLKASEISSANLVSVFQYKIDSAVDYNASILIMAENVRKVPHIKTGRDYLFEARKTFERSQVKYENMDKESEKQVIGGADFYKMNAELNYMGKSIKQAYFSSIQKGFSFLIIISYVNDQQKRDLLKSINTIKFND